MRVLLCVCFVGLSSACASSTVAPPTPAPTIASAPRPSAAPTPSASVSPEAQPGVSEAVHDAAQRLGVSETDIHVDRAESHQWPDASLGCPRQGDVYAQVITPGYLIVVSAAGQQLEYHADSHGRVILCSP